jgi:hypothetical protein
MSQEPESDTGGPDPGVRAQRAARIAELEDLCLRALADLDNLRKESAMSLQDLQRQGRRTWTRAT